MKTSAAKLYLLFIIIAAYAGCTHSTIVPAAPKQIQIKTSSTLGTYLSDRDGHALYMFANDANGQPACTGNCEKTWPPFNVIDLTAQDLDTSLRFTDFGVLQNASGKKQLTYKGWPLYYHAPAVNGNNTLDSVGVTAGDGIGGIWFIAKPDYTIMLANTQMVGYDGKNYKADYTEGLGSTVYFTDGAGLTLYTYKFDKNNVNKYTKADFSNNSIWPTYEMDKIVIPSVLDKTLFSVIDVFGKKQLTYKGWPLYYFGQDNQTRGLNKGISFPVVGIWPVAVKNAPVAP